MELAQKALTDARIDRDYAQNGYVTTTLYPNDLFFVLFWQNKPPKKYFHAYNASVFSVTNGEFAALYPRDPEYGTLAWARASHGATS